VSPTGGPKDTIAPVLVRSVPPLYSTNYNKQRVTLTFDEFIQLKEISQKLILSPPQKQLPEFRIRGKSIELSFSEPLRDSTTYTLYFSDAILDLNEGNPLINFEFAFSTGDKIDSLRFLGRLVDAFTLEPVPGILVMLYSQMEDSIPLKERPLYVTKSSKQGIFNFGNLKEDNYKIFALKDGNSNYIFDQVSEPIAFLSDTLFSYMLLPPSYDLVKISDDKLLTLRLFQEENRALSLTDFTRDNRRRIKLGFSRKPEGVVTLKPVNFSVDSLKPWFLKGRSLSGDTLSFWIINDEMSQFDSLNISVSYLKTDSSFNFFTTTDTLRFHFFDKDQPAGRWRRKESEDGEKPVTMAVKTSVSRGGVILPHELLYLTFDMPLRATDTTLFWIENMADSAKLRTPNPSIDTLSPNRYSIKHRWEHNTNYRFTAMPGAFINLDGIRNDTTVVNFSGAKPEQFGTINLNVTGVEPNVIVELLTEKKTLTDRKIVEKDGIVKFEYVKPGKYIIRFIIDTNRNGKWDTGWYINGIQPERVVMYQEKGVISIHNIRANWEYDIRFNLMKE
jgi:uncharacterized protein (DUF2141 family)